MKTTPLLLALLATALPASLLAAPNQLSEEETAAGFTLLFDGKSLAGWKNDGNWEVDASGAIARVKKGGSLISENTVPDDFELRFEWKVAEASNSGIYYRPGQYEYQILDNAKHSNGTNPRTCAASLYSCMQPSEDATKPVGEWNTGRIVCKGTIIQHWLNGKKVVGFDYADPKNAFHKALLKRRGGDLAARGAKLSLQDHGDPVWYRSIRLRTLSADDEIDQTPVTPVVIPPEIIEQETKKLDGIVKRREEAAAAAAAKKKEK